MKILKQINMTKILLLIHLMIQMINSSKPMMMMIPKNKINFLPMMMMMIPNMPMKIKIKLKMKTKAIVTIS